MEALPQEIRPRVTQESRCCPGDGEGIRGTGRPWGWPKRPHNYKASGSCIAEAIQEIGLIGSLHGRKLVPAGSHGGRHAAAVPMVSSCCQAQGRHCCCGHVNTVQGAGAGALLWGRCWDGDSLQRPRASSPVPFLQLSLG